MRGLAQANPDMSETPLIVLQQVAVQFERQNALTDVSFEIHPRQIVTLLGPNGAGKSTLARVVLGLQLPSSGNVLRKPGLRVGYVPQRFHVEATLPLSVRDFLRLKRSASAVPMMHQLGVDKLMDAPLAQLSGGETQKVLLARAIAHQPDLLVLDEPAQGVDINGQSELYRLIRDLRDRFGCAILMVSHDLHLVMSATDQVLCLNGHICCAGHPEDVSTDPSFVELFGHQVASQMAVYHHHHDHHHHDDGSVASGPECHHHD